jgi:hypothetical protein
MPSLVATSNWSDVAAATAEGDRMINDSLSESGRTVYRRSTPGATLS